VFHLGQRALRGDGVHHTAMGRPGALATLAGRRPPAIPVRALRASRTRRDLRADSLRRRISADGSLQDAGTPPKRWGRLADVRLEGAGDMAPRALARGAAHVPTTTGGIRCFHRWQNSSAAPLDLA